MSAPEGNYVLVVEDPDGNPEIYTHGDVTVTQVSIYPLSERWCPDPSYEGYEPDYYSAQASAFSEGSEPHQVLMSLHRQFTRRLKALGQEVAPAAAQAAPAGPEAAV